MAEINKKLLKKLFQLSGLKKPEKEAELTAVATDLQEILSHFQKIKEIDTKGIKPLFNPLEQEEKNLYMREDKVENAASIKEGLLDQAPNKEGKWIKTPRVI